jgi:hypothetical protein
VRDDARQHPILNLPQYRVLRVEETDHDYHITAEPVDVSCLPLKGFWLACRVRVCITKKTNPVIDSH